MQEANGKCPPTEKKDGSSERRKNTYNPEEYTQKGQDIRGRSKGKKRTREVKRAFPKLTKKLR